MKRLLYYKLKEYLKNKNALVVTGMRQVGKTTILRNLYDDVESVAKLWFDFDNPLDQKLFEDIDYKNIYKKLLSKVKDSEAKLYVFIDEIQNFPEITKIMKYLIDHYKVKFVVTGSSNYYLRNLFPESLSGRKFLYELSPMGFGEFLYFKEEISLDEALGMDLKKTLKRRDLFEYKKWETLYNEYEKYGGFPEVILSSNRSLKSEILKNILKSFFEKDLKIMTDYSDIRELRDLMLLLVPRVGSMIDVSKLASELGVQRYKIYNYLEFLEGTFVIRLISKISKSIDRSVAGGKKVYFTDNGILNVLGRVNDSQLFENTFVNQLSLYGKDLSFYNKKNTFEIDFILDGSIGFEVKLVGTERDLKKLRKYSLNIGLEKSYIVSKAFREGSGILFPMFF